MMGTQTQRKTEHGVIQSSIALLQERFRQLQRVKEMREQRELLRIFSDSKTSTTPTPTIISNTTSISNPSNPKSAMQYNNYEPCSHNNNNNSNKFYDDDEVQIFIPPNYSSHTHSRPCYSSTPHDNCNNEISLSLSPTIFNSNDDPLFRHESFKGPLMSTSSLKPAKEVVISSCASKFSGSYLKFQDSHVSDVVDTTLHL